MSAEFGEQPARYSDAISFRDEVCRKPKQQSEIDDAEANRGEAQREKLAEKSAAGKRDRGPALERGVFGRPRLTRFRAEALHDPSRLFAPAAGEQELGGFGNESAEQHQREAGRQVEYPQDPPAEEWLQEGRGGARGEIAPDGAKSADQHEAPAAVPARHHLRKKRVGNRQHAACRDAHHEAHPDVPGERGHGPANRGPDEHHRREQDRRLPPVDVGKDAPDDGADHRSGERREGEGRYGCLGDMIFGHHAREREAQGGRLHDVDDQRDDQDRHQRPVRSTERRILRRRDDDFLRGRELAGDVPWQQAVGGDATTGDDRDHAGDHVPADRHSVEDEVVVPPHEEHRRVQKHAAGDQDHAKHKSPEPAAVRKSAGAIQW